jgi:hypothetical protein
MGWHYTSHNYEGRQFRLCLYLTVDAGWPALAATADRGVLGLVDTECLTRAMAFVSDNVDMLAHGYHWIEFGCFHELVGPWDLAALISSGFWDPSPEVVRAARDELARRQCGHFEIPEGKGRPGWVYVALCETGHVKIGISQSPEERIKHFDTVMPVEVSLIHQFHVDDAPAVESYLHEMLADYRHKGEWFILPPLVMDQLCSIDGVRDGTCLLTDLKKPSTLIDSANPMEPRLYPFTSTEAVN